MMSRAVIGLGSNIHPSRHVPEARRRLREHDELEVLSESPAYRTAPVGAAGSPFINAAVLAETALGPAGLRSLLRGIEADMGRERTEDKNAPRVIDLDILLYEGFEGEVEGSSVPPSDFTDHAHVLVPAADVAPDWEYPKGGAPLKTLAGPLRRQLEGPMTTELAKINGRYATEQRMEALEDEVYDPRMEANVREMLEQLGEDPEREGLARTPLRVAKAMDFLTSGYTASLDEVVNNAIFEADSDEMVLVKDIEFYSLCEHHVLPFFGRVHVAYMPNKKIIGLSKIARIVDLFSRRLQVQERLTNQIADAIEQMLDPHGVAVVMEGSHFCMMMRGVQKQGSSMVTSAMRGGFKSNPLSRSEFMGLIGD